MMSRNMVVLGSGLDQSARWEDVASLGRVEISRDVCLVDRLLRAMARTGTCTSIYSTIVLVSRVLYRQ